VTAKTENISRPGLSGWRKNGDCSLLLDFAVGPAVEPLENIHYLARLFRKTPLPGQTQVVPAKTSLMLEFAKPIDDWDATFRKVEKICQATAEIHTQHSVHTLSVCYHPQLAPDLLSVLAATGLSLEQLIELHSRQVYTLSMLGFLPGFMYLENLDPRLVLPRKATPAVKVPAGSIAIAGEQCGVYSLTSPGGWHVIGRTPQKILDWSAHVPMQIQPLDKLRFQSISLDEFCDFESRSQR